MDPLAELAPDWTSYRYGFNNPILYIDPDGLFEDEAAAKQHAKDNNIKIRPKSFIGKLFTSGSRHNLVENSDGTFALEKDHTSIQDLGGDLGVMESVAVSPNDVMDVKTEGEGDDLQVTLTLRDGSEQEGYSGPVVIGGTAPGPEKVFKALKVARGLDIGKKAIKFKEAVKRLRNGKDVFSSCRSTAKKLMKKARKGRAFKEKAHGREGEGYRDHFHDAERKVKGHSFFGPPR